MNPDMMMAGQGAQQMPQGMSPQQMMLLQALMKQKQMGGGAQQMPQPQMPPMQMPIGAGM